MGGVSQTHGGWGQPLTRGVSAAFVGGIGGPRQEGKFVNPCVAKIEFGKAGEVEDIIKRSRGLPHVSFQRKSLWLSTTQNLELTNILSVRHPHMKKQVALK